MRPERFHSNELKRIFAKVKVLTMKQMMRIMGTRARMTVLRKLRELNYRTSYSHCGRFYTLKNLCRFDDQGLWTHNKAWFSQYGTLIKTCLAFIDKSQAGYSIGELDPLVHVSSKEVVFHLYRHDLVRRKKIGGVYVYFSNDSKIRKRQLLQRKGESPSWFGEDTLMHELKAAIILFFSVLNEKQRRLFAGLESIKIGEGGDTKIAELFGLDVHTVAKGRKDLLTKDVEVSQIRKSGGGRRSLEKKRRK